METRDLTWTLACRSLPWGNHSPVHMREPTPSLVCACLILGGWPKVNKRELAMSQCPLSSCTFVY